ncbi:MAG: AMMECR1 domain-containing protein [Nitrososphaerales archaeon]
MLTEVQAKELLEIVKKALISYFENNILKLTSNHLMNIKVDGIFLTFSQEDKVLGSLGSVFPSSSVLDTSLDIAIALANRLKAKGFSIKPNELILEISEILEPKLMSSDNPLNYLKSIEVGKDGIIVDRGFYKGVVLPKIALEKNFSPLDMLSYACESAGLLADFWTYKDTKVYKFQTINYRLEPSGKFYKV